MLYISRAIEAISTILDRICWLEIPYLLLSSIRLVLMGTNNFVFLLQATEPNKWNDERIHIGCQSLLSKVELISFTHLCSVNRK
jgi:hypothetical protein